MSKTRTSIDKESHKPIKVFLTIKEWKESYLDKHVACGKKWGAPNLFVLWFLPIGLIVISFFVNFSLIALISLAGLIVILAVMGDHMTRKVCPECAIKDECHAAFSKNK